MEYSIIIAGAIPILGWVLFVERRLGRIEAGLKAIETQLSVLIDKLL